MMQSLIIFFILTSLGCGENKKNLNMENSREKEAVLEEPSNSFVEPKKLAEEPEEIKETFIWDQESTKLRILGRKSFEFDGNEIVFKSEPIIKSIKASQEQIDFIASLKAKPIKRNGNPCPADFRGTDDLEKVIFVDKKIGQLVVQESFSELELCGDDDPKYPKAQMSFDFLKTFESWFSQEADAKEPKEEKELFLWDKESIKLEVLPYGEEVLPSSPKEAVCKLGSKSFKFNGRKITFRHCIDSTRKPEVKQIEASQEQIDYIANLKVEPVKRNGNPCPTDSDGIEGKEKIILVDKRLGQLVIKESFSELELCGKDVAKHPYGKMSFDFLKTFESWFLIASEPKEPKDEIKGIALWDNESIKLETLPSIGKVPPCISGSKSFKFDGKKMTFSHCIDSKSKPEIKVIEASKEQIDYITNLKAEAIKRNGNPCPKDSGNIDEPGKEKVMVHKKSKILVIKESFSEQELCGEDDPKHPYAKMSFDFLKTFESWFTADGDKI